MGLKLYDPHDCLITRLITELEGRSDRAKLRVILPTLRLSTLLAARLAERLGGAILLPKISNFRNFIAEATLAHFSCGQRLLSEFSKQQILRNLLRQRDFRVLGDIHLHELSQLLREFHAGDIDFENLARLRDRLQDEVFRDARQDYQLEKIRETYELFSRFDDYCNEHSLVSTEQFHNAQNRCFLEHSTGFHDTLVVGLTTLTPEEIPCLEKIAREGEVWLHDFRDEPNAPLAKIATQLAASVETVKLATPIKPNYVRSLQLRHEEHQWVEITQAIQKLIEGGLPAAAIAILVTDEMRAHLPRRDLLRTAGFGINCPVAIPLAQTTIGSYAFALCDLLEKRDTLALYNLYEHPLCPYQVNEAAWSAFLCRQICNSPLTELPGEYLDPRIRAYLNRSDDARVLILEQLEMVWSDTSEAERQARLALTNLFNEWSQLALGERPSISEIRTAMNELRVRERGEPLAGVQVLSVDEARSYPFEHVFVVDMLDGNFPKRSPRDVILNEILKRELGLAGWQTLEAMETVTFRSLLQRIPHLHLTFYEHEKTGQKRSKFIDLAVHHSNCAPITVQAPTQLVSDPLWQQQVASERLGGFHDLTAALPHSATSLDRFIQCPYAQLLYSQGIERHELPAATVDLRAEGEWLHAIVEGFFRSGEYKGVSLDKWPTELDAESFSEFALARLNWLTDQLRLGFTPDLSLLAQLRQFSWPRLVAHFTRVLALSSFRQPSPDSREYKFQTRLFELSFHGMIDAVEDLGEGWLVTDYKRRASPETKSVRLGRNAQLPVYMHALQNSSYYQPRPLLAGYWSLLKGEWTPGAVSEPLRKLAIQLGLATRQTPALSEAMNNLEGLVKLRREHVSGDQAFAPDPSDCGYCQFSGICRHADPQYAPRFAKARRLEEYLQQ